MNDHRSLKELLIEVEGCVEHLYLDTRGNATIGVGHLVHDPDRLPLLREDGSPANVNEIRQEWGIVMRQPPALLASMYRKFTKLHLAPEAITALLDADIAAVKAGVGNHFAGFEDYADGPMDALLDMAFNLGAGGLLRYTRLRAAAEAKDWRTCAAECHRRGIPESRNERTRQMFLSAAQPEAA